MAGNGSPQTFFVDQAATFTTVRYLGCAPKAQFGSELQDKDKQGRPKWDVEVIAGFRSFGKETKTILKVGVAAESDPGRGIEEYAPVELIAFQVGVMASSRRNKETGATEITGSQVYFRCDEIRPTSAISRKGE